jgi:hypothetical protein
MAISDANPGPDTTINTSWEPAKDLTKILVDKNMVWIFRDLSSIITELETHPYATLQSVLDQYHLRYQPGFTEAARVADLLKAYASNWVTYPPNHISEG